MKWDLQREKLNKNTELKQKKTSLQWAAVKQPWNVSDWTKVIFSDESQIWIGQSDYVGIMMMLVPFK